METSRPDLVIVHPGSHGVYGELDENLVAIEPPMWARLIAGYVRDRGFTVRIIDAEASRLSPHEVAQDVAAANPRLVCIAAYGHQPSASTQTMAAAGAVAHAINGTPVIMVGGHVSALPERTMREEAIDFACVGEGPATVAKLLDCDGFWENVPGLVWRFTDGTVKINPPVALLDPSELHGAVWDLLPMVRYRSHNWQAFGDVQHGKLARQPYASIYTSLGCPYRCSFCCINAPFGAKPTYRLRNPMAVVDEIEHLFFHYGVRTFKITDEMFVLKEAHYRAICEELILRGLGQHINIWAYARVDTVKPETMALLYGAGIRWLALGIESGSALVRDGAKKALRNDDIVGVVRAIRKAGINVIGNYIFGLPDDDVESIRATFTLACDLNTEFANFYCAMAYPGSPLYDQAVKEGWTLPETWLGYSQHSRECRPLDTQHTKAGLVLRLRDAAFQEYFTRPTYLRMIENKFGPETAAHISDMTRHKLPRNLLEPAT